MKRKVKSKSTRKALGKVLGSFKKPKVKMNKKQIKEFNAWLCPSFD